MHKQKGATLVSALVILTIITLVTVYALEGSNIQSKMIANSLFTTLTYQECRNEQENNVRFYNQGSNRNDLIALKSQPPQFDADGNEIPPSFSVSNTFTEQYQDHQPKSELNVSWRYMPEVGIKKAGYEVDVESQFVHSQFELDCQSTFRFASSLQTLGAIVEELKASYAKN